MNDPMTPQDWKSSVDLTLNRHGKHIAKMDQMLVRYDERAWYDARYFHREAVRARNLAVLALSIACLALIYAIIVTSA